MVVAAVDSCLLIGLLLLLWNLNLEILITYLIQKHTDRLINLRLMRFTSGVTL